MNPMPSNHPLPTIARLALSLYASTRTIERLPVVTETLPVYVPGVVYVCPLHGVESFAVASDAAMESEGGES